MSEKIPLNKYKRLTVPLAPIFKTVYKGLPDRANTIITAIASNVSNDPHKLTVSLSSTSDSSNHVLLNDYLLRPLDVVNVLPFKMTLTEESSITALVDILDVVDPEDVNIFWYYTIPVLGANVEMQLSLTSPTSAIINWGTLIPDPLIVSGIADISYTYPPYARLNTEVTWTPRDTIRNWAGLAVSSDGKYQTATERGTEVSGFFQGGRIYISDNYGVTWTETGPIAVWSGVAMSSDGRYQTAVQGGGSDTAGRIYISDNYGATWVATGPEEFWVSVAMSSDGRYQTTGIDGTRLYISDNYGATWTSIEFEESITNWISIAMSSDGRYQTAVPNGGGALVGQIQISDNYGATWVARGPSRCWISVAMSSDGRYRTATENGCGGGGQIYISNNYGETWVATESIRNWSGVAMSIDGKYQTAGVDGFKIYTSVDYGITWVPGGPEVAWSGVAMSIDGKYQTAVSYNGFIYTYFAGDEFLPVNLTLSILETNNSQ